MTMLFRFSPWTHFHHHNESSVRLTSDNWKHLLIRLRSTELNTCDMRSHLTVAELINFILLCDTRGHDKLCSSYQFCRALHWRRMLPSPLASLTDNSELLGSNGITLLINFKYPLGLMLS